MMPTYIITMKSGTKYKVVAPSELVARKALWDQYAPTGQIQRVASDPKDDPGELPLKVRRTAWGGPKARSHGSPR